MTKTRTYQNPILRKTLLLKLCMLLCLGASARGAVDTFGITVFGNASLYTLDKAQVGIFSSITNHGIFGAVQGTVIHMSGERWTNMPGASLPDELGVGSTSGVGGVFRFASRSTPQYIVPGFSLPSRTGISFPNLTISNPFGVTIEKTDAHVRNTLHLEEGLLWLNSNNLLVGVNDPGIITGYSKDNFVATGNSVKGGFLYRAKVSAASGSVLFPIGPQANSYAPLSIMYNTTKAQDLHVRAFDEVYSNAIIGTKGNLSYVQQTWNIGQENTDTIPSIIALQHNDTREGAAFTAHRGNSYISKFDFDVLRAWDTLPPSGIVNPAPYTTGPPLTNAYVNTRIMNSSLGLGTYLTKAADSRTDSLTLGKGALSPVRQPDGSFLVTFMFFVRNEGMYRADSLEVLDSLALVFKNTMSFGVQSVVATGNLKANAGFDGVTNTDLLLRNSSLAPNRTDTITLVLNVRIGVKEQYYYNTANVRGVLNGFNNSQYVFNNRSVNGFAPPTPGTLPVPTPVILSESKFNMPHGFSPNGDGVNDRFVIGNLGNNKCAVWIFDKNGVYVYKNMDYHNDWDGTINQNTGGGVSGQKIADGTYFYKVVITDILSGTQETFNGFISVWK